MRLLLIPAVAMLLAAGWLVVTLLIFSGLLRLALWLLLTSLIVAVVSAFTLVTTAALLGETTGEFLGLEAFAAFFPAFPAGLFALTFASWRAWGRGFFGAFGIGSVIGLGVFG
jgi:hypothetical protein